MNDILFGNNNNAVIQLLAKKSFSANRRRNLFVITALILTSFMITSVFSIGFSYFETYQMQQIRFMGTTADVAITNTTEEQLEQLEKSKLISDVGISQRLGGIDTSQMENALLGLVWLNDTEWKTHRLPAISNLHGSYPTLKNEVILPTWVLEQMGISAPQLGMEISLSYQTGSDQTYITSDFVLSGYYTDYQSSRTNHRGAVYVSTDFKDTLRNLSGNGVSAMIGFINDDVEKNCEKLKDSIDFTPAQTFEVVPSNEANGTPMILVIALITAFISISGYLLIYNILYISVSKDTRFYGQLKTIGTTKRQIKKIVRSQVLKTSAIGIPIGLLLGAAVSFGVVPYALSMMYSGNADMGVKISFAPVIFVGAAIFTLLTALIGSMKPAQIAGSISPIAALRFTEVKTRKENHRGTHGVKPSRMAWANIFRNRKSPVLVYTSLFLGLCLFLVTAGILSSLSPENFVNQWGESDFVLTYSIHADDTPISEKMVSEIEQLDGIENIRFTYAALPKVVMNIEYNDTVFKQYVNSLDGKGGLDFSNLANIEAYTQNFYSGVYGIDSAYVEELNLSLKRPVDMALFESGKIVLLSEMFDSNGDNLIKPGQAITVDTQNGQRTFTVADGFLPADFQSGRGNERGTAPDLYISQNALKGLTSSCRIFRIAFDTTGQQDANILRQLKVITASSPEIQIISRFEKREEMSGYLITTKVLGMGLSAILLLIGVMNFINTMVVSVNTRKHEFAVLESIGMTKKQVRRVLRFEGCYYWAISFGLVAILGTGIYILLYSVFKQLVPYAVFSYPICPLLLIAGIVLVVCLIVPIWTYKSDIKDSVVERLKINE